MLVSKTRLKHVIINMLDLVRFVFIYHTYLVKLYILYTTSIFLANAPPLVNTNNETLQYLGHDIRYNTLGAGTLGYVQAKDIRDVILVPPLANITVYTTCF